MSKVTLKCAIYTRKSTEEGLEQQFNSLDAQREACAAFILSQASLGWKQIIKRYDDGGISGGTMERPALHDLLQDIKAGKLDVVVVYKIDRLTRSLMDFAKIVEILDANGASFVSVTQQFNTSTSMGRLTLNVLLSFAQFEREVTAERIRDKIAASKKKGLWMGGVVPLGYVSKDKGLVIEPAEAETVREIFRLYREIDSVRRLKEHLDRQGCRTKVRRQKDGSILGGKPFTRGHLYWLLSNPIYAGLIRHGTQLNDGQHEGIIDRATWEATQQSLTGKAPFERKAGANEGSGGRSDNTSVLAGLLFDETGDRLSPSHAVKNGIRYRYYVSQRLIQERRKDASAWRLPARAVEEIVIGEIAKLFDGHEHLRTLVGMESRSMAEVETVAAKAKSWHDSLQQDSSHQIREKIRGILQRVTVEPGRLTLVINRTKLASMLGVSLPDGEESTLSRMVPFLLKRRGVEAKLILGDEKRCKTSVDQNLIGAISQAHIWMKLLTSGASNSTAEIATKEGIDDGEVSRLLPLAFLAPDIVEAILEGRQPVTLTARYLKRLKPIPSLWSEQRRILGFGTVNNH